MSSQTGISYPIFDRVRFLRWAVERVGATLGTLAQLPRRDVVPVRTIRACCQLSAVNEALIVVSDLKTGKSICPML